MIFIFTILFILSFCGTIYAMPHSIRKLRENGYLAKDMYKLDKLQVPTNGGIILVFTSFISICLLPLLVRLASFLVEVDSEISDLSEAHLALLLVVSIYALYGLVDDLVDIGRILKLILPIAFSYPLISVIKPTFVWLPFLGNQDLNIILAQDVLWSDIFRITIIPLYVMVVANLVNMHSGYNGLQSGLSIILLSTICFKSYLEDNLTNIIPIGSILGSMVGFYLFNKYPARVFEGNIGSLFFGSVIGSAIVLQHYWWFGFFILIPHSINFILWIVWLRLIRIDPDNYLRPDGNHQKFGNVDPDGNLIVPNRLTLKWIPNFYFKMNEKISVRISYMFTIIFCILGLFLFN